ncbi:hypothetical protein A7E78_05365 [Syntrophotalea acetylenivorans]|uniref:Flagellar hook-length control protein-like C-terminal domain-containing protein n=1 Tax=Syntrophotalea acetylenivorans TaxID=1842532 RepID=A0A1L3GN36_9BACT|nr:flagellar hook-length control protein FliK [Syntrophotalea acetylenivorans]APG27321.1 hypothetical protein A7E78_05365 [Syntrophotalea acetylenivorans]
MEMLNIPPAQPQTKPPAAPKGTTDKCENASFQNVLGKASKNAQKDPHNETVNATEDGATGVESTAQPGGEATKDSQPVVSAEGEEQTTEPSADDTTPVELVLGAVPSLPAEAVQAEPISKTSSGSTVAEDVNSVNTAPLLSEAPLQEVQTEAAWKNQVTPAANAAYDGAIQKAAVKDAAPFTEQPAASTDDTATKATQNQPTATETSPIAEKIVVDSVLRAGLAKRTASVDSRQKAAVSASAASAITQINPATTSEQTDLAANESGKKAGLMEGSLGSLLQEVRPLRDLSRGRQNASLNRSEIASIAISGEASAQVVAETQNEDSLPSFASKQENGFSVLQSDAATNGANSAINATTFESALNSGIHGSPTAQQGNQPLQAAPVESASIRLASGEFLSENQIVDQVLERISVERVGDQSRIVVKMNPEELGEVKLALTMEKDQLRAQLLTQNHQVQEILEKHLPKLHEALNQQGIKLEDIQVGVDSNRHSGREAFADHRQPDTFHRHQNAPTGSVNNDPVHTTASARSVSTEGLSLRI